MEVEKPVVKIEITPRELYLMLYCIDELLAATKEMSMKRGFDHNKQNECRNLSRELEKALSMARGEV